MAFSRSFLNIDASFVDGSGALQGCVCALNFMHVCI